MKVKQRKKSSDARSEVVRDEQWRTAFERQATTALRRRALNVARGCIHKIEMAGGYVTSAHAEDLVDDALAKTWFGRLSWDPVKRDLLEHINSAIESTARHQRKKAKKFPTASLDAHDEDDEDERAGALWSDAEEALAANAPATNLAEMMYSIDVFERVRALAAGDLEILTLLDAIRAGAFDRADLMQAMGMSARRYESARRRLDTLLRRLPPSMLHRVGASASEQSAA
jgi:hypothetical protein